MNVLGVNFDSKLTRNEHVGKAIRRSSKAMHRIRMLRKFFNKDEIRMPIVLVFVLHVYGSVRFAGFVLLDKKFWEE